MYRRAGTDHRDRSQGPFAAQVRPDQPGCGEQVQEDACEQGAAGGSRLIGRPGLKAKQPAPAREENAGLAGAEPTTGSREGRGETAGSRAAPGSAAGSNGAG